MKVTGEPEAFFILKWTAVLPVPGSIAKRAATSMSLPGFEASPMKRRRKRFGPCMEMSYLPEPWPRPMLK